ncbi:MAG TPA: SGNH/GDSL hydrolase family protein [Saprospiraceae bacterium]|nr:SGNH/GDSL hydrolase family protein [Saprospiraceae bacterium]
MPVFFYPYKKRLLFIGFLLSFFHTAYSSPCLSDNSPVLSGIDPPRKCTWVILGSSTAEGAGASVIDSSWVSRLQSYLQKDPRFTIINLGKGGITSFHIMPGLSANENLVFQPDTTLNIDRALDFLPRGIIVNMPSNDAAHYIDAHTQMNNYRFLQRLAHKAGSDFWITTSQPRNFGDPKQINIQEEIRDSILHYFGNHAIDLFTPLADSVSWLLPKYGSGDGIHLNDAGHRLIFETVVNLDFIEKQCDVSFDGQTPDSSTIDAGSINLVANIRSLQWMLTYKGNHPGPMVAEVFNANGKLLQKLRLAEGWGPWPLNVSPELEKTIRVEVSLHDGTTLTASASIK